MPINVTDVDEFTSPIVVPADSDPANGDSVRLPFQQLANRTRFLTEELDRRQDADGYWILPAPVSQSIHVAPALCEIRDAFADYLLNGSLGTTDRVGMYRRTGGASGSALLVLPLHRLLPAGAVVTRVRAAVIYSGSDSIGLYAQNFGVDFSDSGGMFPVPVWISAGTFTDSNTLLHEIDSGAAGNKMLDSSSISVTVGPSSSSSLIYLEVNGPSQAVVDILVDYTDAGGVR